MRNQGRERKHTRGGKRNPKTEQSTPEAEKGTQKQSKDRKINPKK